uniref:Cinnamoyl-CoA reductase family protein n=1 Tax=Rhizophora mucronata TaxID=61149 RepID=A0A2P2NYV8_RHIMU
MAAAKGKVCVTGAGGYLGSWLVRLLISKDYFVHGTVREPLDQKYAHLNRLDKAPENLSLFKADLLDCNSLCSAIEGCTGVFHVASPVPSITVPNPEVEVIEPAVKGTLNVLEACVRAKAKRVVLVSSVAAVNMNPSLPTDQVIDESCWSSKEHCRATKNWYCFSKVEAESKAWEYAKRTGLDLIVICPTLILGPVLQSSINASSRVLIKLLKGGHESMENKHRWVVDVRDVAEALVLVHEKPEAEGRYICTAHGVTTRNLVEKLRGMYPNYSFPKNWIDVEGEEGKVSSERLQRLGWSFCPLEETLVDSVESYRKAGMLE